MDSRKNKGHSHPDHTEIDGYFDTIQIEEIPDTAIDEALYKKLEQEFGDKAKRELREKLQQIGEEYYVNLEEATIPTDLEDGEKELVTKAGIDVLERKKTIRKANDFLQKMIQGDPTTLEEVYAKYAKRILALIRRYGGSVQDAQDVLQDALIIIFEKGRSQNLELTCSFYVYLHSVCYNIWRNRRGKASYKNISLDALEFSHFESPDDVTEMIEKQEESNLFWDCLKKLKEKKQELLYLSFSGKSTKEIQKAMDYSSRSLTAKNVCLTKKKLVELIKNDPRFKEMND